MLKLIKNLLKINYIENFKVIDNHLFAYIQKQNIVRASLKFYIHLKYIPISITSISSYKHIQYMNEYI